MTVEIKLTKGYVAVVDDEDADLAELKWQALVIKKSNVVYAQRTQGWKDEKKYYTLHRLILSRILDRVLTRKELTDHVDLDGLNNRRGNLRLASKSQNSQNRSVQSNNKTGHKGVYFFKPTGKYRAFINHDGKQIHLGYFDTPEEGHIAYCKAAQELFGEFARLK